MSLIHRSDLRARATSSLAQTLVVLALVGSLMGCDDKSGDSSSSRTLADGGSTPATCQFGSPVSGRFYPNADEIELRQGPGTAFDKVVNEIATSVTVGHATVYATVSKTQVFEGRCATDRWLQGKIVESDGSPVDWKTGWVLKRYVSSKMSQEQAAGVLWDIDAESDFSLDQKKLLHKVAAQVLKDNPNCGQITDGYFGSEDGSFYVTCTARDGREPFNVTFKLNDVGTGLSLAVPKPYPEADSRKLCESAILRNSAHPSTVEFYRFTGYATTEGTNGNREIIQMFDAKNGFNLKLAYKARCLIMPSGKVEVAINEVP